MMQKKIKRKISLYEEGIFFPVKSNDLKIFNVFNDQRHKNHINQQFFVTKEGCIGTIISITKELYDYFSFLEKEILNTINKNTFDYEEYRLIKVII